MIFLRRLSFILALSLFTLCFVGCGNERQNASTPSVALKAYLEAAGKKDAAAMKTQLSSGTLKIIEETARAQNISLDEALARDAERSLSSKIAAPEIRNETITGDTATLEVKNPSTGGWDKLYLVKENGSWKIAFDKMMQEMLKDADESAPQ